MSQKGGWQGPVVPVTVAKTSVQLYIPPTDRGGPSLQAWEEQIDKYLSWKWIAPARGLVTLLEEREIQSH